MTGSSTDARSSDFAGKSILNPGWAENGAVTLATSGDALTQDEGYFGLHSPS
jgi:hypothetical protein